MSAIPLIFAGPILRKCTPTQLVFWFASREPLKGRFTLSLNEEALINADLQSQTHYQVGKQCWITLCQFESEDPLPVEQQLNYQFITQQGSIETLLPDLLYDGEKSLTLIIKEKLDYVMHGSCRNPHHRSEDSLVAADLKIARLPVSERPALLMHSGDQIYADHVAGPTLVAIQQVIQRLGLYEEIFEEAVVENSQALYRHPCSLLNRQKILPKKHKKNWLAKLIMSKDVPVLSATDIDNHLISFAEFIAMYLLVWSPILWQLVDYQEPIAIKDNEKIISLNFKQKKHWLQELENIEKFVAGLSSVQRLLAHIPNYMIFDDHDVTDDWNLTAAWEDDTYHHAFSRRIIGNGLLSYWLCQGWGNDPNSFGLDFHKLASTYFEDPQLEYQNAFIEYLLKFEQWHYTVDTKPKILVLDTRTRRWRSESNLKKPSGLMDWEALSELQHSMLHEDNIIIVSPAPMFGVKFIEALQKVVTWMGLPLVVDAENWMAHKGAANVLLSIFKHRKTPQQFIILSGDVHYSFVYDISIRFRTQTPMIYQVTCSGLKNEFPNRLLRICERLDRILYATYSPLNYFTKRKSMKIRKRDPSIAGHHRLVNQSAIGEIKLDKQQHLESVTILTAQGECIDFPSKE